MTPVACRIQSRIPRNWRGGTHAIKWLLSKQGNLSSNPQHTHFKKPGLLLSCNPSAGHRDRLTDRSWDLLVGQPSLPGNFLA